jgi:hypothetical protein
MRLTESRVRTKLSTSIESVAPSFAFSSVAFLGRAIVMGMGDGGCGFDGVLGWW